MFGVYIWCKLITCLSIANPYLNRRYFYLNLTFLRFWRSEKRYKSLLSCLDSSEWVQGLFSPAFTIRGHYSYETNHRPFKLRRARNSTHSGRKVLAARRAKGRHRLAA